MSTERHDKVRARLSGCSHTPKMSAISAPRIGGVIRCFICRRDRTVIGYASTWQESFARCTDCDWELFTRDLPKKTKKSIYACSIKHANDELHRVQIWHEGDVEDFIRPSKIHQLDIFDTRELP